MPTSAGGGHPPHAAGLLTQAGVGIYGWDVGLPSWGVGAPGAAFVSMVRCCQGTVTGGGGTVDVGFVDMPPASCAAVACASDMPRRARSPKDFVTEWDVRALVALSSAGLLWLPVMRLFSNELWIYVQSIASYLAPAITAVFWGGVFWSRANRLAPVFPIGAAS